MELTRGEKLICLLALGFVLAVIASSLISRSTPAPTVEISSLPTTTVDQALHWQGGKLNLNTADATDLESLPGIGAVLAQRILDYRSQNGSFVEFQDLLNVPGLGQKTLDELLPYLYLEDNHANFGS